MRCEFPGASLVLTSLGAHVVLELRCKSCARTAPLNAGQQRQRSAPTLGGLGQKYKMLGQACGETPRCVRRQPDRKVPGGRVPTLPHAQSGRPELPPQRLIRVSWEDAEETERKGSRVIFRKH